MRVKLLVCLIALTLGGCADPPPAEDPPGPVETTAEADAREAFVSTLASGSNGEVTDAAASYFTVGAEAAAFQSVLGGAQDQAEESPGQATYRLWLRGKDPDIEGDGWVEVKVDTKGAAALIESVRTVVLKK